AVEDRQGLREGGDVGRGRARGDHVQRIADHVREEERGYTGPGGGACELATLEEGAVLPHRVELVDVGAGREHQPGHRLLVGQGNGRHRLRGARLATA